MVEFTKKQLSDLRRDMQHVLDSAQFGGCKIDVGNCTYMGGEATFKVTVLLDGAETKEQKYLTDMARIYNLDTTKIANTQGKKFSLVGYKSKAPKMPWIVQDLLTGHEYKLTHDQAERLFKKPVEVVS
tara:strand:- start:455 stop:838 length:384 start_codon:yes stop_codon:yes gene_type:complete